MFESENQRKAAMCSCQDDRSHKSARQIYYIEIENVEGLVGGLVIPDVLDGSARDPPKHGLWRARTGEVQAGEGRDLAPKLYKLAWHKSLTVRDEVEN